MVLVRTFSYSPNAEFNGISLTLRMLVLVRSFYYTADTNFREEFLLHSYFFFFFFFFYPMLQRNTHDVFARAFVTLLALVLVRSFLYSPLSEEFLLHS